MNEDKSTFLICDCHSHALFLEKFNDEEEIYISFFERGMNGRILTWKERLKWCWQIIRYGQPWTDSVILGLENQKKLKKFLNESIE